MFLFNLNEFTRFPFSPSLWEYNSREGRIFLVFSLAMEPGRLAFVRRGGRASLLEPEVPA
jgi:hypothetical protein